jgi:hypothetical protein
MKKAIIVSLITTVIIYGLGLTYLYYSNEQYKQDLAFYDVNKNGVIDKDEINQNSKIIAQQGAKRKTTNQGALILIPFSLIIGGIAFAITSLFKKIKTINDNEIIKSKSKRI